MCGINGIIRFDSNSCESQRMLSHLQRMNNALSHRGPDDQDVWCHEHHMVGLGQTRLSILDLSSAGHQPMPDLLNGNMNSYNVEIFNYSRLNDYYLKDEKFESERYGDHFKAHRKMGLEMVGKLNGMFAFCLGMR